jgi:hypothetical protein
MKMNFFGKFAMDCWKIEHENKILLENLPFDGNMPINAAKQNKFFAVFEKIKINPNPHGYGIKRAFFL